MAEIISKIAKLINVKSIVTLVLVIVFSVLALNGVIDSEQFVSIFTVVIAFYFGTQYEKKNDEDNKAGDE